ncbi:MAG TPA: DUF5666 domain-containing protein [Nitrospira sp.]|nr:DUF5666 domain-containing protein [Nitrospira sp.]
MAMMYRWALVFMFLFMSATVWAHGTGQHVLGTVMAIDATHVEVKTPKGATVSVKLTKETRFKEKGKAKSSELPSVGDRVVIEATKDNNVLTATEVHFSVGRRGPTPERAETDPPPAH